MGLSNYGITRPKLLKLAETIPGAWVGIKIAVFLLILEGWKSSAVARLFGISRMGIWKWEEAVKGGGPQALEERLRSGRRGRLMLKQQKQLEKALQESPEKFGFQRARWDGHLVSVYLEKFHQVKLKVRQSQVASARIYFNPSDLSLCSG